MDPCLTPDGVGGQVELYGSTDLYIGDTSLVTASLHRLSGGCGVVVPSTPTIRALYKFAVADQEIATTSDHGVITGISAGTTTLTVRDAADSIVATTTVWVSRPIANLRLVVTPSSPKAGDTISVVAQAIDASGLQTPGAHIRGMFLSSDVSSGAGTVTLLGGTFDSLRVVIPSRGKYSFWNSATHKNQVIDGKIVIDVP